MSSKIIFVVISIIISCRLSDSREHPNVPAELLTVVEGMHSLCADKTGVKEEEIRYFNDYDTQGNETNNLKCYMYCLHTITGTVDINGDIIPKLDIGCDNPIGDNQCEKAFWLHNCLKSNDQEHYLLI